MKTADKCVTMKMYQPEYSTFSSNLNHRSFFANSKRGKNSLFVSFLKKEPPRDMPFRSMLKINWKVLRLDKYNETMQEYSVIEHLPYSVVADELPQFLLQN